tara:strand:- start:1388 stop:3442 length:2055 start_codon:yes stop_codon:yes gene_type:complete
VAGANYEVNIQLKADPALKSLERIEQKINQLTKTSVDLQDARGAAMVKNRNLADRINKLEEKGVKVAKMRERLGRAIEKTDKGSLQTAAAHEKILRREVKAEERLLQVKKQQQKVDRQQARRRGPGRAQEAILGGGFPLLFGGSPVSALGGAVGGALGGLGGGIAGQILADRTIGEAARLGKALNELTFDLEAVVGAAGFADTETAQLLERIEQYGDAAVSARLATELLEKRIGVQGVQALKDFGEKAGELGRALSTIFTQVLAKIAEVAGPLLSSLAKFVGQQADIGAFKARTGLEGREKLAQDILTMGLGKTGTGGLGVGTAMAGGVKARAKKLGITDLSDEGLREFAKKTATESQRAFELPTIKEIELEASLVQDPSQKAASRKALSKAERQQLKEFLELNKLMTLELDRQEELDRMAGEHIAKQLNDADKLSDKQEKRKAKLEGIINGTERESQLKQAIKEITEKGLLPADEERLIAAEKQIFAMEDQAEKVKKLQQLYQRVGSSIENALVGGIMAAIDGTKSLQSLVTSLLKDVGKLFLQFGIRTALNAVSPSIFPMAQGGYVSGPTTALVGEGGQGEYVIPENKMRESMARYSRGARGSAVVPETGASGTSGEGGGTAVAAPIDVRYSVERINNVDYVTAEQFQAGLTRAAQQGAAQGEQRTLRKLKMSPSSRRGVGF